MKKLSKAQRRAMELITRGWKNETIVWQTMQWLRNQKFIIGYEYDFTPYMTNQTKLTDKGRSYLATDRKQRPVAQCQYCGNWRDVGGEWTGCPMVAFDWWCNGVCEDHYGTWHDYEDYPEWIADE